MSCGTPLATPWGELLKPKFRLMFSGAFKVQSCQSYLNFWALVRAELMTWQQLGYRTASKIGVLSDDAAIIGHFDGGINDYKRNISESLALIGFRVKHDAEQEAPVFEEGVSQEFKFLGYDISPVATLPCCCCCCVCCLFVVCCLLIGGCGTAVMQFPSDAESSRLHMR